MSETAKHRSQVQIFCAGNGVDLGSSGDPVVPWAIKLDLPTEKYLTYDPTRTEDIIHWRGDATNLPFKDGTLDFCHSSHLLEDFENWQPILKEWDRALKIGGYLIIAVPDHARFRAAVAAGQGDNLNHKHESHVGELTAMLPSYEVISDRMVNDDPREYSILYVGKKVVDLSHMDDSLPESARNIVITNGSGFLWNNELQCLLWLAAQCSGDILEIGCNNGQTTAELANAFPAKTIHACDFTGGPLPNQDQASEQPAHEALAVFAKQKNVNVINCLSADLNYAQMAGVRFVFIDADHTFAGVRTDTIKAMSHLAGTGWPGVIVWHDAGRDNPDWVGVRRYLESEIMPSHDVRFIPGTRLAYLKL